MLIAAIDPGPEQSALVVLDTVAKRLDSALYGPNDRVVWALRDYREFMPDLVIEWISSYGQAVGQTVFLTCRAAGRFQQCFLDSSGFMTEVHFLTTIEVRIALCHTPKSGPPQLRAALIDRFGGPEHAVGVKKRPGPLYALRSAPKGKGKHLWSALAVAVAWSDLHP